ncbi:hypothetical protein N0V84_011696 [Fusarium piperis]|uniref:Uncharacterized protein n=1 Tax=Fusarium piperis TaxID=1435070 RepID=A0A9W8TA12_9HYPO|nr:hypothetical protein N0V84_011696 [Fusarium piperis]
MALDELKLEVAVKPCPEQRDQTSYGYRALTCPRRFVQGVECQATDDFSIITEKDLFFNLLCRPVDVERFRQPLNKALQILQDKALERKLTSFNSEELQLRWDEAAAAREAADRPERKARGAQGGHGQSGAGDKSH